MRLDYWCKSQLTFEYKGDDPDYLERVHQTIKGDTLDIDFNKIIPGPESGESEEWYLDHWGCPPLVDHVELVVKNAHLLQIRFDTVERPAALIAFRLMEMFPDAWVILWAADRTDYTWLIRRCETKNIVVDRIQCLVKKGVNGEMCARYQFTEFEKAKQFYYNPRSSGLHIDYLLRLEPYLGPNQPEKRSKYWFTAPLTCWWEPEIPPDV